MSAEPKNIVLIGPVYPYRGGIAHYTTLLAKTFAKQNQPVKVISFRRQYPAWLYPGESDRDPSQNPLQVEAEYLLDPLYPWTWWATAQKIAAIQPSLVIIQWWTTFWALAFAALAFLLRRQKVPVLFIIHNVMPHEARPWDKWLARLALKQAQRFLVMTEREQERLLSLLPQAQTIKLPHPVYDMFAGQKIPQAQARKNLGLEPDGPVLLFFGIIRPYKGLRVALEALGKLRQHGQKVSLLVAGEFWEPVSEYTRLAQDLGVLEQIKINNRYIPDEEIGQYFSAADLFIAPYVGGTQSGAVKMALGFGLPAVVSRAVFSKELENYPASRISWVEAGNAQALAEAIAQGLEAAKQTPAQIIGEPATDEWEKLAAEIKSIRIV